MELKSPSTAVGIAIVIVFLIYWYGVRDGSLFLFDVLAGVVIYKLWTRY